MTGGARLGGTRLGLLLSGFVLFVLLIGAVVVAARWLRIEGLAGQIRVASGSMYPTLTGPHQRLRCPDCDFSFRCGSRYLPRETAVCPNCGFDQVAVDRQLAAGDQVLLRRIGLRHQLNRWDIVTYGIDTLADSDEVPGAEGGAERAGRAGQVAKPPRVQAIKRIVGLPGERLEIAGGDLFADGRRLAKPWRVLRQLAVVVYDHQFSLAADGRSTDAVGSRWRADPPGDWHVKRGELRFDPSSPDAAALDYVHRICVAQVVGLRRRAESQTVLDHNAYNQALPRGQLHAVGDLLFAAQMRVDSSASAGRFRLEFPQRRAAVGLEIRRGTLTAGLWPSGRRLLLSSDLLTRPFVLEAAVCDGRLMLAVDGQPVAQDTLPAHDSELFAGGRPGLLRVVGQGAPLRLRSIRLLRDVHYLGPRGESIWKMPQLGPDRYLVVGDNVPASLDGRHWSTSQQRSALNDVENQQSRRLHDLGSLPRSRITARLFKPPGIVH